MKKEWKSIDGYDGLYEVSNTGEVKSLLKDRLLKPSNTTRGYLEVTLTKNKTHNKFKVHRLVAHAFLINPENKKCVNHIDGDKHNNFVSNLEWCSDSENREHAYRRELRKMATQTEVEMYSSDGIFINKFNSMSEASRKTGINVGNISRCCNSSNRTARGYVFKKAGE